MKAKDGKSIKDSHQPLPLSSSLTFSGEKKDSTDGTPYVLISLVIMVVIVQIGKWLLFMKGFCGIGNK